MHNITFEIFVLTNRWRAKKSVEVDVIPFAILSTIAINQLVFHKPRNIEELINCKLDGFSDRKYQLYGLELLQCIIDCLPSSSRSTNLFTNIKQEYETENEENAAIVLPNFNTKQEPIDSSNQIPDLNINSRLSNQNVPIKEEINQAFHENLPYFDDTEDNSPHIPNQNNLPRRRPSDILCLSDSDDEQFCKLSESIEKKIFSTPIKRKSSTDLWPSGSDDEELSQIVEAIEKQMCSSEKQNASTNVTTDSDVTDCELDLLLNDIEKMESNDKIYFVSKKNAHFKYIDSDSEEEKKCLPQVTTPNKKRILPAWMQRRYKR